MNAFAVQLRPISTLVRVDRHRRAPVGCELRRRRITGRSYRTGRISAAESSAHTTQRATDRSASWTGVRARGIRERRSARRHER